MEKQNIHKCCHYQSVVAANGEDKGVATSTLQQIAVGSRLLDTTVQPEDVEDTTYYRILAKFT